MLKIELLIVLVFGPGHVKNIRLRDALVVALYNLFEHLLLSVVLHAARKGVLVSLGEGLDLESFPGGVLSTLSMDAMVNVFVWSLST